ncbi:hypothetical protein KSZ_44750 [Dictyobacter formicarum]|uniref:Uncharacterized protein n=1 Tax=Dictyobacter formicarum TaxID=2778368 RepID=A0ABQ3VLB4_9CHLR|nr:hypothetical protein KSZ_44750 [Dictyobacter formicarum]
MQVLLDCEMEDQYLEYLEHADQKQKDKSGESYDSFDAINEQAQNLQAPPYCDQRRRMAYRDMATEMASEMPAAHLDS